MYRLDILDIFSLNNYNISLDTAYFFILSTFLHYVLFLYKSNNYINRYL